MHVQYAALCDQVIVGADGRPSLINVFNDLQVQGFPTTVARLAFAARLLFTPEELGRTIRVEVQITDPAGKDMGRPGGELNLPPAPPGIESLAIDIPLQLDLFEVASTGRYTFLLSVDGNKTAAVQLAVRTAPANV